MNPDNPSQTPVTPPQTPEPAASAPTTPVASSWSMDGVSPAPVISQPVAEPAPVVSITPDTFSTPDPTLPENLASAQPAAPIEPPTPPQPPVVPAASAGGFTADFTTPTPAESKSRNTQVVTGKKPRRFIKVLLLMIIVLLVVGGGAAAAYFAVIVPNKPSSIWADALTNSGKGYDALSNYATTTKSSKGMVATGSFSFTGSVVADGSFTSTSEGVNSESTGSLSVAGLKVGLEARTIKSTASTPDLYIKADGLQGLGTLLGDGDPTLTNVLNGVNNQWYVIDHSLLDQYQSSASIAPKISASDVNALLKSIGTTSKQYVFTSDAKNMAVVVKQNVGKETQDGINVYHYKIGLNGPNTQAYIAAICNDYKNSTISTVISKSLTYLPPVTCQSPASIKVDTSSTVDAWVDLHTRLVHKLRFTDKTDKSNFLEISQNYTGGDTFPFGLAFQSGSGTSATSTSIQMTLNTKTNTFTLTGTSVSSDAKGTKGNFKLNVSPSDKPLIVSAPTGAKTIVQLLNDLGIPSSLSSLSQSALPTATQTF